MDHFVGLIRLAEAKLATTTGFVKSDFLREGIGELRSACELYRNAEIPRSEIDRHVTRGLVLLENGGCFDDER